MDLNHQQVEVETLSDIAMRMRAEQHDALGPGRVYQQGDGLIDLVLLDHGLPFSSVSRMRFSVYSCPEVSELVRLAQYLPKPLSVAAPVHAYA